MRRMIFICVLLGSALVFSNASAMLKRQVAVFTFEDKSGQDKRWWNGKSPGDGMTDMLITALVKSGKYVVVERREIQKILNEQRLGQSGLVNAKGVAQVGKLLGVDLAIMGAITEFGLSKESTGGKIDWLKVGVSTQKATVAADIRFVDTATGEIIAAEAVRREKSKSGLKLSGREFGLNNRSDFDDSLIGKATREVVSDMVALIGNQIQQLPWQGKVLKVSGNIVYIKPGSDGGVGIGDIFSIYRIGEKLIDPDTGLSLGSDEEQIGSIQIQKVVANGKAAKGIIIIGEGFKAGDIVRPESPGDTGAIRVP